MKIRAGAGQFAGSRNWEDNLTAVGRLTQTAADNGVQMIGFHELASTIYPPFSKDPALLKLAEPESGASVTAAREIARRNKILMVFPFYENEDGRYYNSAVVIGPDGAVLMKYRKSHVPDSIGLLPGATERDLFGPGDQGFPTVETPFGARLGVIICYDRNLPESARCSALNGAEILYVPVTTISRLRPWWELLLRARAVENMMFVCAPSRVGLDKGGAPGAVYIGESLIVDPAGEILSHAGAEGEELVWADLDLDLLRKQRETWGFFKERRPQLYGAITRDNA
ncbi:MAG TPA: nitrilase-related carbon-nitrogen hydrolase [Candidatus Binataceae bacterium]|nr:nitrilase-related carbon-nitrogen hydrolase [Candidatus Binataceae bacterium]